MQAWLEVDGRDLDYPLDGDGTRQASGSTWWINPAHIAAVRCWPESSRGDVVEIFVRGIKQPIAVCGQPDEIMRQLRRAGVSWFDQGTP
jgi:hypothetical protein